MQSNTGQISLPQIAAVGIVIGVLLHACVIFAVLDDGSGGSADTSSGPNNDGPTIVQTPPTATRPADRTSCAEIRGTDYRSDSERAWFIANCT
jgi:hypothetical protein